MDRMIAASLWVTLHTAAGTEVYLRPSNIVTVRDAGPASDILAEHVHCIITTDDGKFLNVTETCKQVLALISAAKED